MIKKGIKVKNMLNFYYRETKKESKPFSEGLDLERGICKTG